MLYVCSKQPYSPLHECPNKPFPALIGGEDEFVNEEGELDEMDGVGGSELNAVIDEAHFTVMELSLYSVGGIQGPKQMKFHGIIGAECSGVSR